MNENITVYVKASGCAQCMATERALDKAGIAYTKIVLTQELAELLREQGHQQAPVVITENDSWTGFRPDKIEALAKRAILPSDATREARSPAR